MKPPIACCSILITILGCSGGNRNSPPPDPKASMELARALDSQGNWDQAISYYSYAIQLDPNVDDKVYQLRGNCYLVNNNLRSAIWDFTEYIERRPSAASTCLVLYNRGVAYAKAGESEAAISDFSAAIALVPQELDLERDDRLAGLYLAHVARAEVYLAQGEHEKAVLDCEQAIQIHPSKKDTGDALYTRGRARLAKGQYEDAITDFSLVIGESSMYRYEALLGRASAFAANCQFDEAIVDYTQVATESKSYEREALEKRAAAYVAKGKRERARDD